MSEEKELTGIQITFELSAKQREVLKALIALPQNAGKSESEACRILVIQCLINAKQQMIAQELSQ